MGKTLVAYFSCTGTTGKVAEALAKATNADLYKIQPAVPYTKADLNWNDANSRTTIEMKDPACRPALSGKAPDMAEYDAVFLGFPIWWYTAPRIIDAFLESCDLSGKLIAPFATSGSSGLGKTEERLRSLCPKAVWKPGKLMNRATGEFLEVWARDTLK